MKTIGLLGGMSWESTAGYYRIINQEIKKALGGLHSAKVVLYSVDFAPIETLMQKNDWEAILEILSTATYNIQVGGADFLLICTNTIHKVAPQLQAAVDIPIFHIADATGSVLRENGITKAGLLGTSFTMEHDFYKKRLKSNYNIDVLIPEKQARKWINDVIFQELCLGKINPASKKGFLQIIAELSSQGAEAVILGCTEIGMLLNQEDTPVKLFDTTVIHAQKAVEKALEDHKPF